MRIFLAWHVLQLNVGISTVELHLAVSDLSAMEGLLDAVLRHQLTKAFRLIVGKF